MMLSIIDNNIIYTYCVKRINMIDEFYTSLPVCFLTSQVTQVARHYYPSSNFRPPGNKFTDSECSWGLLAVPIEFISMSISLSSSSL